jgi:sigma-B regulation protein RsbU (phosphoserine phosphatase)
MLVKHNLLEGFATLFVGVYDVVARTLTYVNAGQEPGLLLRRPTNQMEELEATGPVLGALAEAGFSQAVTQLAPGDVFALFTDGLTEAGANRKDLLEVSGVSDILREAVEGASEASDQQSSRDIADRVMAGVIAAVTPAGIRDDVCLLVAKVTQAQNQPE